MKRNKEFECANCNKIFVRPKNRLNNGRINPEKLKFCDECWKICTICGNRHGKNGETCSKECIKALRERTNNTRYGVSHNWGKDHPGRKTYEHTMMNKYGVSHNFQKGILREKQDTNILLKYGVTNVFKLEEIKNKIKETNLLRYGVENPKQNKEIISKAVATFKKNIPSIRKRNEEKGLWIPLNQLDDLEIYYRNVASFTATSIRMYGDLININDFAMGQGKGYFTIDHRFSKKEGFLNNISPEIIGSIVNLEILEHSINSRKGSKCSITQELLYNMYKEFKLIIKATNENQID